MEERRPSSLVEPVELSVLPFDIAQEWFGVETHASHPLGQMIGREHATPAMNLLT